MTIKLPELKYQLNQLEPILSKTNVDLHYNKHTRGYFDMVNQLIEGTIFENNTLDEIIENKEFLYQDTKLFNNVAQAWNHAFYWNCLSPVDEVGEINDILLNHITSEFGSFQQFKIEFSKKAIEMFGSGWCWLVFNKGKLQILTTPNAITPATDKDKIPLLVVDVWEHAYLYDAQYAANRKKYVEQVWSIIDWNFVNSNFLAIQP